MIYEEEDEDILAQDMLNDERYDGSSGAGEIECADETIVYQGNSEGLQKTERRRMTDTNILARDLTESPLAEVCPTSPFLLPQSY